MFYLYILQGGVGLEHPEWFNMDALSDYPEINNALYENTSLLPYDSTGPDVYSLDSGAESLQELFNSMQESNSHVNVSSSGVAPEETGVTGIKIRPRQPQQPTVGNSSAQQGFAIRRIRLQCLVQAGALSSLESDSSAKKEDNEDREATVEVRSCIVEALKVIQVHVLMDINYGVQVEQHKEHDDIINGKAITVSPHIKLEGLSINGNKMHFKAI